MNASSYISFKDAQGEGFAQEVALLALEAALDDALTNDDWCRIAEIEDQLRSQIDRVSTIFQNLKYLESN